MHLPIRDSVYTAVRNFKEASVINPLYLFPIAACRKRERERATEKKKREEKKTVIRERQEDDGKSELRCENTGKSNRQKRCTLEASTCVHLCII